MTVTQVGPTLPYRAARTHTGTIKCAKCTGLYRNHSSNRAAQNGDGVLYMPAASRGQGEQKGQGGEGGGRIARTDGICLLWAPRGRLCPGICTLPHNFFAASSLQSFTVCAKNRVLVAHAVQSEAIHCRTAVWRFSPARIHFLTSASSLFARNLDVARLSPFSAC